MNSSPVLLRPCYQAVQASWPITSPTLDLGLEPLDQRRFGRKPLGVSILPLCPHSFALKVGSILRCRECGHCSRVEDGTDKCPTWSNLVKPDSPESFPALLKDTTELRSGFLVSKPEYLRKCPSPFESQAYYWEYVTQDMIKFIKWSLWAMKPCILNLWLWFDHGKEKKSYNSFNSDFLKEYYKIEKLATLGSRLLFSLIIGNITITTPLFTIVRSFLF